jgi:hypothetical protein
MIPDAKQRLEAGLTDLKALLVHLEGELIFRRRLGRRSLVPSRRRQRVLLKRVNRPLLDNITKDNWSNDTRDCLI